jgi:hypothetical protein
MGAIDGTLVQAYPPAAERKAYRTRKHGVSMNVLACCRFDMLFTYVLAGWEGSRHDGRVYQDALTEGLKVPEGYYYLADAGFTMDENLIIPYRNTRYHLQEWNSAPNG